MTVNVDGLHKWRLSNDALGEFGGSSRSIEAEGRGATKGCEDENAGKLHGVNGDLIWFSWWLACASN